MEGELGCAHCDHTNACHDDRGQLRCFARDCLCKGFLYNGRHYFTDDAARDEQAAQDARDWDRQFVDEIGPALVEFLRDCLRAEVETLQQRLFMLGIQITSVQDSIRFTKEKQWQDLHGTTMTPEAFDILIGGPVQSLLLTLGSLPGALGCEEGE